MGGGCVIALPPLDSRVLGRRLLLNQYQKGKSWCWVGDEHVGLEDRVDMAQVGIEGCGQEDSDVSEHLDDTLCYPWVQMEGEDGPYFFNEDTGVSQSERPEGNGLCGT